MLEMILDAIMNMKRKFVDTPMKGLDILKI
jgi:hypothetical protein